MRTILRLLCVVAAVSFISGTAVGQSDDRADQIEKIRQRVRLARQELAEAEQELAEAARWDPTTRIGDKNPATVKAAPAPGQDYPFWSYTIRLSTSFGYESNPRGLTDDLLREERLDHKSSAVTELSPSLTLTRAVNDTTSYAFGYELLKDYYHDQSDINLTKHTFSLTRKQKFRAGTLTLGLRDELNRVNEDAAFNQFSFKPQWEQKWGDRWRTLAFYTFLINDFALPNGRKIAPVTDPDSLGHIAGLTQKFVWRAEGARNARDLGFALRAGYFFAYQDADGDDLDRMRHRIFVGFGGQPLPESWGALAQLGVDAEYQHDFDQYENKNSASGPAGYAFERSDNLPLARVTLTYPLNFGWPWEDADKNGKADKPITLSLFSNYSYDRRDSNIRGLDKDNHIVRLGLISDF